MATAEETSAALAHVESFTYRPRDIRGNADLIGHVHDDHHAYYERWDKGNTIGDIEDQHYISHGLLTSEDELIADVTADLAPEARG